jgi:acyl-[acyl-carrier-protein]-phospholipid O-acyltransferase / long-chain-fatty-acid--[acyl-carrier-protein] ligase
MVPHLLIEDSIREFLGDENDEEAAVIAVAAVPDERKGERLVVLHQKLQRTPDEICRALAGAGLPNLWIPSPDSFHEVDEVPHLSTGKLDLRAVNELARRQFCEA